MIQFETTEPGLFTRKSPRQEAEEEEQDE